MKIADALDLSIKVLSKTLDMNKLTPDKIEIATLRRINGKTVISIMPNDEMTNLIQKFEASEKAAEEAKRLKELQQKSESK